MDIKAAKIDPMTEKCFNLPPSDPESFASNMFFMNQAWVQARCILIKDPKDKCMVHIKEKMDNIKKVIANEEQLNDLQILDVSCDEQSLQKIINCTPYDGKNLDSIITQFNALLKEKEKTCAVFFPMLCKNTTILNYVYMTCDVFARPIEPTQSPKLVHGSFFLHSVLVYRPEYAWRSIPVILPNNNKDDKIYEMMFRHLLSGYNDECCICTETFSKCNFIASICPHCASPYCAKCTKKLKKGKRKNIICAYCKQKTLNYNDIENYCKQKTLN